MKIFYPCLLIVWVSVGLKITLKFYANQCMLVKKTQNKKGFIIIFIENALELTLKLH